MVREPAYMELRSPQSLPSGAAGVGYIDCGFWFFFCLIVLF